MKTNQHFIFDDIINGDYLSITEDIQSILDTGTSAKSILRDELIPAMAEVGRRFEVGEFYLPEMLVAARTMQKGLNIIKPMLMKMKLKSSGRIAIGTVSGDLHDIGKNIVSTMLEGAGFEIIDLGTDVKPGIFIETVSRHNVNLIAMSALLTTTMTNMDTTIRAVEESGLREQVKILIGGAPVTREYALKIGADGYAENASQAVRVARKLINQ